MGCGTTTSNESATDAKCASSCSGVCSVGAIGCTTGWQEWPEPEALLRPDACATTPASSGQPETGESLAIGYDGPWCCERAVAQGVAVCDECADASAGYSAAMAPVREAADPAVRARVWRWMVGLSVGFWLTVTLLGLRGCWG